MHTCAGFSHHHVIDLQASGAYADFRMTGSKQRICSNISANECGHTPKSLKLLLACHLLRVGAIGAGAHNQLPANKTPRNSSTYTPAYQTDPRSGFLNFFPQPKVKLNVHSRSWILTMVLCLTPFLTVGRILLLFERVLFRTRLERGRELSSHSSRCTPYRRQPIPQSSTSILERCPSSAPIMLFHTWIASTAETDVKSSDATEKRCALRKHSFLLSCSFEIEL